MLLDRETKETLDELDRLLRVDDRVQLESRVHQEISNGLLEDRMLSAARAMQLPPVVMFLATLGHYNLPAPNDRSAWLAIYQSLSSRKVTPELARTPADNPMRQIVEAILAHDKDCGQELEFRFAPHYEHHWIPALELALDWEQYAVALRVLQARAIAGIEWLPDHWLKLAKAVLERLMRKGVRGEIPEAAEKGELYALIHSHLPVESEFNESREWLSLIAGEAFLRARQADRAIEYLGPLESSTFRVRAWIELASARCFKDELEQAIPLLDRALLGLQEPGHFADYIDDDAYHHPDDTTDKRYDIPSASAALRDLQGILMVAGLKPFIVAGTLLGHAREGKILDHDKDMDIGIVGWEDQYPIVSAVIESGKFEVGMGDVNGSGTYFISLRHRDTGHYIDLFFYHDEDGKYVTGVHNSYGFTQKFAYTPFGLQAIEFMGLDFYAPDDIDRMLSENYGNWRVPDKNYQALLEAPSIVNPGGIEYQICGRLLILENIRKGNLAKLDRALAMMKIHSGRADGLPAPVISAIEHIRDAVIESREKASEE